MLNLFDRCYRKGDPKMMHVSRPSYPLEASLHVIQHCAQTLLEFNGGASCVQVYVNQHDFFINNVRESKHNDDVLLYVHIVHSNLSPSHLDLDGIHYRILMQTLPRAKLA